MSAHDIKTASLAAWIYGRYMFCFKQISYFPPFPLVRRREGGKYREREGENVKSESLEFGDKISPTLSNAFSANNSTFWLATHKVINGMEKMKCGDIVLHHHISSPRITNDVQVNQSKVYKICTLAERHWRRLTQAKKKRQNFFVFTPTVFGTFFT